VRRRMQDVSKADVVTWRDDRMTQVSTSSARREYGLLRAVFAVARDEWGYLSRSPFDGVAPPPEGKERSQRVSDAEIATVCAALGYEPLAPPQTASHYIALAMLLAVETALRKGEILTLDHNSRVGRVIHLQQTKNGDERAVPLSTRAAAIIDLLPHDGVTFPVHSGTFDTLFRRARDGAGLTFHFHDLRREATTRLARKFNDVMKLSKVTGHRDIKTLMRVYYAPDVASWAELLD
jgi:integrase